jgi:hypothetical protein
MENTQSSGSRVTFNLTPSVSFYKRRRPHVEQQSNASNDANEETNQIIEPTEEFTLQPLNLSHVGLDELPAVSPLPPQPPPPLSFLSSQPPQPPPPLSFLSSQPPQPPPPLPFLAAQPPQPPPPLDLRTTLNQIIHNNDESWPPRLSICMPKRWLYDEEDRSPIDYKELQRCRQLERELVAEAQQRAYVDFLRSVTPPYHGTPHSQRTPASIAHHCSLPPSPLSLSPTATPRVA